MSWWSKHVTHSSTFRKVLSAICLVIAIVVLVVCCVFGFAWAGIGIFQAMAEAMAGWVGVSVAATASAGVVAFKTVFLWSLFILTVVTTLGAYADAYAEKYDLHQSDIVRSTSVPWKTASSFAGSRVVSTLRQLAYPKRSARRINRPSTRTAEAALLASVVL